jgi:hypothetical protein
MTMTTFEERLKERQKDELLGESIDDANEMLDRLREVLNSFDGMVTIVTAVGVLETLKFQLLRMIEDGD